MMARPVFVVTLAVLLMSSCQHVEGGKLANDKSLSALASLERNVAASSTVLVGAVSRPGEFAARLIQAVGAPEFAPVRRKNQTIAALLTAQGRVKTWGFDPATLQGWQTIGIDPRAGFAWGLLSRPARLVIALKIDDPARVVAFLNARFGGGKELFAIKDHPDGSKELRRQDKTFARWDGVDGVAWLTIGNKTDGVAVNPVRKPEAPALNTSAEYQRLKPEGEEQVQLRFMPSAVPEEAQRAMQLQPGELLRYIQGFVWSLNEERSRSRLLLGDKGQTGLSRVFGGDRAPANVSGRVLNDDHFTLRLRLNLATVLDGVLALVPDKLKDQAAQPIGHAQGLLMLAGNASKLGWPGLAEAINGDLTVAFPKRNLADAPRVIPWTGMVAILAGNQAKAIVKMLEGLSPTLIKQFGAKPLNLKGHTGFFLQPNSRQGVYVLAVDDGLLVALEKASLAYFLALPSAAPSGSLTDEKLVFGYHIPAGLTPESKVAPPTPKASNPFGGLPFTVSGVTRLVDGAIVDEQPAIMVLAMVGILAAVAIPNFIKFQCRAKQSEAKSNLKAFFQAQKSYFAEYDEYHDLNTIGFDPEPGNRYTYCNTPTDCRPCEEGGPSSETGFPSNMCKGISLEQAQEACVQAGVMRTEGAVTDPRFVGCAVGRLQADGPLDVWTINDRNQLINRRNACD